MNQVRGIVLNPPSPLWPQAKNHQEKTFSFIKQGITENEANEVGLSFNESNTFVIESHWCMAHIVHAIGIFPSVGQARKNGWDFPIDRGYTEFAHTKKCIFCFIWNPPDGL